MKKSYFLFLILIAISLFTACENVKIEEDYYYTETETIDGIVITLKGNGYGLYGQLIEDYKTGSIKELMAGKPMKIRSSEADDNNASYNEIFLTFEKKGLLKSFTTDINVKKMEGLSQVKLSYIDKDGKEIIVSSSYPMSQTFTIEDDIQSITLYIKGFKYYPTAYSSLNYKNNITEEQFKKIAGDQVHNEFVIKNVSLEF